MYVGHSSLGGGHVFELSGDFTACLRMDVSAVVFDSSGMSEDGLCVIGEFAPK